MAETIANYDILKKIATGGMAEVYLAKQKGLGGFERLVCIKRILPHLTEQQDFITMFQDEARIAANLTHPNVAQIYDIGESDGSYYIAMEYVRGEDLRRIYNAEVARGRAMPLEPAAQMIMYAAAGLDYAHRQTTIDGRPLYLVHRDISPQNLLVTYDGHVKVVDFGVAKAAIKMSQTRSGVLKGKYSYMSPEQASGDPIDARSDIFALGVTLYEITTGTRLFKRENELETLHAVIECKVRAPRTVIPDYDSELENAVMRCLAYDPDDRYATAADLERDLERFLVGKGHPVNSSSLGLYMQDLFAEKLADELLLGGQPWEEENTPSRGPRSGPKLGKGKTDLRFGVETGATDISHPFDDEEDKTERTLVEEAWGDDLSKQAEALWESTAGQSSDWTGFADTSGETHTKGRKGVSVLSHDEVAGAGANPMDAAKTDRRRLRPKQERFLRKNVWFLGLGVLLCLGVGFGLSEMGFVGGRGGNTGPLVIDTEPRGARIEFFGDDAKELKRKYGFKKTPITIKEGVNSDGNLRLRIVREDYESAEVDLSEHQLEAGVAPDMIFVELTMGEGGREMGTLMLLSDPPGASVLVNGKKIEGVTPLTGLRVAGGQFYHVEFRKGNYEARWETRYMQPGMRLFIEVNLTATMDVTNVSANEGEASMAQTRGLPVVGSGQQGPSGNQAEKGLAKADPKEVGTRENKTSDDVKKRSLEPGFLKVEAGLKLQISSGKKVLGSTPLNKIALRPGRHQIRARSFEYGFVLTKKIHIKARQISTLRLDPGKGKLALNASPWAWVQFGRQERSETPVLLDLHEGDYVLRFECPNGRQKKKNVRIKPNKTQNLSIDCTS
jgi:serine/threonine protein kinase